MEKNFLELSEQELIKIADEIENNDKNSLFDVEYSDGILNIEIFKTGAQYVVNKQLVYDVLLENRSALVMISTNGKHSFVNRILTNKLCDSGIVQSNIPYKQLIADDAMPMCRSYSAGKNSW